MFGLLPELWHLIVEQCDNKSLILLKQVSKYFNSIDKVLKTRRLNYPKDHLYVI